MLKISIPHAIILCNLAQNNVMKLKWCYKLSYGIGNLGYSVVSQTITNFFMFFGTSVLKIPGSLIGIAVAISTIWDGLTDPIVGYISDNYAIKHMGHRNGYMLIATLGISLTNIAIWCVPLNFPVAGKFVWVMLSLILIETFNTLFATPYTALSSDLVHDYNDRTAIQIYKTIFFLFGMMLPSVLLNFFLPSSPEYPQGQLNPMGYRNIAVFTSIAMLICGFVCVFGTLKLSKRNYNPVKTNEKFSFKAMFKQFLHCFKNKHLRIIIVGYSLSMISGAILTSIGMHFFTYCFNYSSLKITILLTSLLLGMVVSQPFWYKFSIKEDKKPALIAGMVTAIAGVFIIMLTYIFKEMLISSSFYIIAVAIAVVGFGSGTLYSLPGSMYLDVISLLSTTEKDNKPATYSGFLTLACNIANAIALLFVGVLLDAIKFNPTVTEQNRIVQTGIAIILFVGVLISLIASLFLFSKYQIKEKHLKNKKK